MSLTLSLVVLGVDRRSLSGIVKQAF